MIFRKVPAKCDYFAHGLLFGWVNISSIFFSLFFQSKLFNFIFPTLAAKTTP